MREEGNKSLVDEFQSDEIIDQSTLKKLHFAGSCLPKIPIFTTPQELCRKSTDRGLLSSHFRLRPTSLITKETIFGSGGGGGQEEERNHHRPPPLTLSADQGCCCYLKIFERGAETTGIPIVRNEIT